MNLLILITSSSELLNWPMSSGALKDKWWSIFAEVEAWQLNYKELWTLWRQFIHIAAGKIPQELLLQSSKVDRLIPQIPQVPASQCDVADQAENGEAHKNLFLKMKQKLIIKLKGHKNLILKVNQKPEHVWTRQRQLMNEIQRLVIL